MATLVLTAVGTAIGGPIGGAIGAMIGQAADRTLLARPAGRQGPRLRELSVQTSSYGTQVPRQYGTMRVAGTVIWASDIVEHRATARAGKGQPKVTTYSYSASFAVALSARPIRRVGRIWADGKLLRGAAGDWKTRTGFRLHPGGEAQDPDPLIASAEGAALTPAHRGIAYAVFEDLPLADFGNRIPSLTFEVVADDAPVSIGAIARDIAGPDMLLAEGAFPALHGFSAYGDGLRGVIETLAEASGAWFGPDGDTLTMRAAPPDAPDTLDPAAFAAGGDKRTIRAIDGVAQTIALSHYDPARDFQIGCQRATRQGPGARAAAIELPAAVDAPAAKALAGAMLMRAEAARTRRRIAGDAALLSVRPGQVVRIGCEAGAWRVAETTLEGMAVLLDLVPVAGSAPVMNASPGRVLREADRPAGRTLLHAAELPMADGGRDAQPHVTVVATGTSPGWRNAALSYSLDEGASWIAAGISAGPGVVGLLSQPLVLGPATVEHRGDGIEVDLAHGMMTLQGADARAIDAGANAALVGEELIQFRHAVQVGPSRWWLDGLFRGRRGTPPAAHPVSTRFVLIEEAAAVVLPVPAGIGRQVRIEARGVGDDDPAPSAGVPLSGASLLPPSPVRLTACRAADGTLTVRWRRRSRTGWRWTDGADAPLGEERERYRLTIVSAAGESSMETSLPEATIPGANAGLTILVRQLGDHGASPPAVIAI